MADKPTFPPTQRIGILVFDGFEPIDVFGFVEAFAIARFLGTGYASPPPYPFETVLIASKIAKVKSANGPSVAPDLDLSQALQRSLDLLMVPGGGGTWPLLDETSDPKSVAMLVDWMRARDKKVRIMASVCTGAAVLAKCGLDVRASDSTRGGSVGLIGRIFEFRFVPHIRPRNPSVC
jgi:putative intracellular protease/amidase